ncbi:hypothetical protein ACJZ2D_010305 [Fusarium nematophilum]
MRRILFIFPQPRKAAGGLDKFVYTTIFLAHNAVGDTVRDNDIGTIASGFGKISVKESGIDTSILIDTALIGWGLVMAQHGTSMQALAEGLKDGVLETQNWLFGGSEEGNNHLRDVISNASMVGDSWLFDRRRPRQGGQASH